jgi:hypothetical protein
MTFLLYSVPYFLKGAVVSDVMCICWLFQKQPKNE